MKKCGECDMEKDDSCFSKDRGRPDGLNFYCKDCANAMARRRFHTKVDKKKHAERVAMWRAANPDTVKIMNRTSHSNRKEQRNAESRAYRAAHLERMRALNRQWAKDNWHKMKITNATRRAVKRKAIPQWAKTEWEKFVISEMYDLAKRRTETTGTAWHVDHIVPLRHPRVQGLHCVANLRVIPGVENHRKGNRVWPNM